MHASPCWPSQGEQQLPAALASYSCNLATSSIYVAHFIMDDGVALHCASAAIWCALLGNLFLFVGYLGERNPTSWLHTIQLGEPLHPLGVHYSATCWTLYDLFAVAYCCSCSCRALGDYKMKRPTYPIICPDPFVAQAALTPADRLLLLASDGVTDVLSDDAMLEVALAAAEKAQARGQAGQEVAAAAAAAVQVTALEAGAYDNVTAVAMLLGWE
jgi:hypothetical protein